VLAPKKVPGRGEWFKFRLRVPTLGRTSRARISTQRRPAPIPCTLAANIKASVAFEAAGSKAKPYCTTDSNDKIPMSAQTYEPDCFVCKDGGTAQKIGCKTVCADCGNTILECGA